MAFCWPCRSADLGIQHRFSQCRIDITKSADAEKQITLEWGLPAWSSVLVLYSMTIKNTLYWAQNSATSQQWATNGPEMPFRHGFSETNEIVRFLEPVLTIFA